MKSSTHTEATLNLISRLISTPFYHLLYKYNTKANERRRRFSVQADEKLFTVNVWFTLLSTGVIAH